MDEIEVAFIGGSGLYKVPGLKNYKWVKVSSNFGLPSNKICIGTLNKKNIALNNQWIDWASLVFGLQCATYTAHNMLLPVEQRNPTIASETKKKIITSFEILDNQLHKYNFILRRYSYLYHSNKN